MNRAKTIIAALGLSLTGAVSAAEPSLDWLAGRWCGGEAGERIEEHWMTPVGAELLGQARTLRGGRMVSFEFMRIVRQDDGWAYLAQPGGQPATAFRLTNAAAQRVQFDNPQHDFPQRIDYWREADGLHAAISGPDGQGGQQRIAFHYRPCNAPAAGE